MGGLEALVPIVLFVSIAAVVILRGPLGRALGERWAGGKGHEGMSREETEALRAEVEDMRYRLTEVEERLDFTERMLAQRGGREQLQPGG
jgi:hypothetical protein